MKLYRIHEKYISQPWYNKDSIFKLIEIFHNRRIRQFGIDCLWENIETGTRVNNWDSVMVELNIQEARDVKLKMII